MCRFLELSDSFEKEEKNTNNHWKQVVPQFCVCNGVKLKTRNTKIIYIDRFCPLKINYSYELRLQLGIIYFCRPWSKPLEQISLIFIIKYSSSNLPGFLFNRIISILMVISKVCIINYIQTLLTFWFCEIVRDQKNKSILSIDKWKRSVLKMLIARWKISSQDCIRPSVLNQCLDHYKIAFFGI